MTHDLKPHVHSNIHKKQKQTKHSLSFANVENVNIFLLNFGEQHELPSPGKLASFKGFPRLY